MSDEEPQPGHRIELDGRWYVVPRRHDRPAGDLLDAMLEVALVHTA